MLDSRFTAPDTVLTHAVGGELVLLNLASGTYFSLDPIGTRIWQRLVQPGATPRVVAAELVAEYEVSEEACRRDVLQLAAELHREGLLRDAPPAG